jgi:FKBP-type peptidyl-prolyl cis-trans isomerase
MNIFERKQQHMREILENEIKRGMAFLAENAKRPEVTETPSGLQYEVLVQGDGEKPSGPRAKVLTHYHGTTIDGIIFDSSVLRNDPISFGLNQVITGWTEGVQLMNTGSKYKFFIPHHLAYGERGAGADIPGGATLIFEVELLKTN